MDLIDTRSAEYNGFKWIFHSKDYFLKSALFRPLIFREVVSIAETLKTIVYEFGLPQILQSDNGHKFAARVMIDVIKMWPELLIVNGRPRHSQDQALIETSNAVVQQLFENG